MSIRFLSKNVFFLCMNKPQPISLILSLASSYSGNKMQQQKKINEIYKVLRISDQPDLNSQDSFVTLNHQLVSCYRVYRCMVHCEMSIEKSMF